MIDDLERPQVAAKPNPKEEADEAAKNEKLRTKLVRWFEEADEGSRNGRVKAERDQDYYDNKQLTDAEVKTLTDRGQPPIAINLIRRKVDSLRGLETEKRSDPKAWPRTPADADSAEIATDTLRYIFDATHYNQSVRKWVWKDILVVGWGGLQLRLKPGKSDQITQAFNMEPNPRVVLKRTPWDRMFWDPTSSEHDFSDCRYRGLVLWMDRDQALGMYKDSPKAQEIISSTMDGAGRAGQSDSFGDKPKNSWVDISRKRVRVVQIWWKEMDEVYWAEFTLGGILKGGVSPFVNEDGDPCDNFIWQSCYVDRDNNRHGIVRDMVDPQDEVNKRRSKSLHLLTVRQVIADEGVVQDVEKAKRQIARPDGWITKTPGLELEIVQNADLSAGQMQLLQHATSELEKMGPSEQLQGRGGATSGRDRQAQQQGALLEVGPTVDDLMWTDLRAYNLAWATVQKYWTAPQFVRITDRDDAPRFVGLNEPMIMGDQPVLDQNGQMAMRNQPAELNVDIIILPAPDTTAIEQEVWEKLMDLVPLLVSLPLPWAVICIEASPLRQNMKRKLIDILKSSQQQQDPQQQQMAQQAAMLELADKEAGVMDKRASAGLKQANAQKIMADGMRGPEGPAPMTPMDMAKIRESTAKTASIYAGIKKTQADTIKTITDALNPRPHPQPGAPPAQ